VGGKHTINKNATHSCNSVTVLKQIYTSTTKNKNAAVGEIN
jgi:hypothetical protein